MPEQSVQSVQASPLQGKRILVTRTAEQAETFSEKLAALGAIPVLFPTIRIEPPSDWRRLDTALEKLFLPVSPYTWVVFTSANGVSICCERLRSRGFDPATISSAVRVAAIGPATAATLARYGIPTAIVPHEYIAESVAVALIQDAQQRGEALEGKRILLARAAEARKILITALQQAGAIVDEVPAYYTRTVASDDEQGREIARLLQNHQLDILTFTSSSTVRNFMQWLRSCEGRERLVTATSQPVIACIGPITSSTARELGLPVHIEAQEFTIDGLIEALLKYEEKKSWQTR
ncbi:MAG: uroporphyrinogen-III synthase [Chloroflexota bacterium]|nr:uroporphyrinogen-III synthase [Chloroflexota bacterium]